MALLAQEQVRLGAARLRAGPRGGGPARHVDQSYRPSCDVHRRGSAGVAGALTAPLVSPTPYMGHPVIITAFIIIIVGGVGSLEGAVLAAVLYGFVNTFVTTIYDGTLANIVGLLLMLVVLIVKPTGLFGAKERA
jgi:hypothetical protein